LCARDSLTSREERVHSTRYFFHICRNVSFALFLVDLI
jgi:hypothetical protein